MARRIFDVLGDSDCRTAYVITGTPAIARRILGDEEASQATFVDPDRTLVKSLGLEQLPAFVFLQPGHDGRRGGRGLGPGRVAAGRQGGLEGHGLVHAGRRSAR